MPTFHYPVGGSTAARTINCPGWLKASEGIERRPPGQAAIDGSMLHEIMEMCFVEGKPPTHFVGHVYEEREFLKEDLTHAKKAYNTMNALLDELDIDEFLVEPLVTLIPDLAGGSIDLLGISADRKTALIADYKFGRNVVSAEANEQGLFYAVSAMADPNTSDLFKEVDTLVLAIIQPHSKTGLSRWTCDMKTVENFRVDVMAAIGKTGISPGNHCKYCPALPTCPAARKNAGALSKLSAKSDNELAEAAAMVLAVEDWVKDVKEEIYLHLKRGQPVPGWKLVNKRATRKWIDPEAAEAYLIKHRIPKKLYQDHTLRSAPKLLDILAAEERTLDLDAFIEKKSAGTTAKPLSDEAEAIELSVVPDNLANLIAENERKSK